MARTGKGKPDGSDEQIKILRDIWNEIKTLNASVNTRIGELREETKRGFEELRG